MDVLLTTILHRIQLILDVNCAFRSKNKTLEANRQSLEDRARRAESKAQHMSTKVDLGEAKNRTTSDTADEVVKLRKALKEAKKKTSKLEEVMEEILRVSALFGTNMLVNFFTRKFSFIDFQKRHDDDEQRLRLDKQVSRFDFRMVD
jgi:predicted RNase H-like nuclease (RuvC/YqgF family)